MLQQHDLKRAITLIQLILLSYLVLGQRVKGTYESSFDSRVSKHCQQLTLFSGSTYEHVICREIMFAYDNTWKMNGDTILFHGNSSGLPIGQAMFLFRDNKLYAIREGKVDKNWSFRRKSRRTRSFRNDRR